MTDFIQAHEPTLRLGAFLGIFAVMALWEVWAPRRHRSLTRAQRWPANIGIVVLNTLVLRLLFPVAAAGTALWAGANGWGLFNALDVPAWLAIGLSIVLLDLAIYAQHVLVHHVPMLWRLHRMHHADLDIDLTTGARFHPAEIVFSMVLKMGFVAILGAPVAAVVIFEIVLSTSATFNHANARLPLGVDRLLRLVLVTPDMHRVHHSAVMAETNSNYGFALPWWDRLFGTYTAQPAAGHDAMTIGLEIFRDPGEQRLDKMLMQPLRNGAPE